MELTKFVRQGGLKSLSLASLASSEYAVFLYILNAYASGLQPFATAYSDMAQMTGWGVEEIRRAVQTLLHRQMIHLDAKPSEEVDQLSISPQLSHQNWIIKSVDRPSTDAVVYSLTGRRHDDFPDGQKRKEIFKQSPAKILLQSFLEICPSEIHHVAHEEESAKRLVDKIPLEQILGLLQHFRGRLKSLRLLETSWDQFYHLYVEESQRVDFSEARKKHQENDEALRASIHRHLEKTKAPDLSEDEMSLLQLLLIHKYPRRQLFWAYQTSERYPSLKEFFEENKELMLSVTNSGHIVKKK